MQQTFSILPVTGISASDWGIYL